MTEEVMEVVDEVVTETEPVVEETVTEEVEETVEETTDETVGVVEEEPETEEVAEEVADEVETPDYAAMYAELEEKYNGLNEEYSAYKAEHSFLNEDVEALKTFKETTEKNQRLADETALFAKYEKKIGDTEDFAELKKNASNYDLNTLEKECLFIVGKYAFTNDEEQVTETKKPDSLKFSIEHKDVETDEDPYGGLKAKYLK